jgi:ribosomal-protein-alanine N-acetyltransferase
MAEIRAMTAPDLDAVIGLAVESTGAPRWTRQIYEDAIGQEGAAALVATSPETLAGFVMAVLVVDVAQIESIVVAPDCRRRGIASALVAAVIDWSRARNAGRVELEVRAGSLSAIALYEKAGFVRDGLRRGYYHDPEEDALLMSLTL